MSDVPMSLGVVIIHFYHPAVVDTLTDIVSAGIPPSRIALVDNGSADGFADSLREAFPEVMILDGHGNIGYAGAVNLGARALGNLNPAAILILTHEVRIDSASIGHLLDALAQSADVAVVAPTLFLKSAPQQVWSLGGDLDEQAWFPTARTVWCGPVADWVDGSCFLVRTQAFKDVGGMHQPYFLYLEEVDFFARIRRSGKRIEVVPEARALQEPGGMSHFWAIRNRALLIRRLGRRTALTRFVVGQVARILVETTSPRRTLRCRGAVRARALRQGMSTPRAPGAVLATAPLQPHCFPGREIAE